MINIMYAPWADYISAKAEETLLNSRRFSLLDIQLSGECNFNCRYCDSPDRNKQFHLPLSKVRNIIRTEKITCVYICGLGEPTVIGQNYNALIEILKSCDEEKIQCSIFTNLYWITDELIEYIKNGTLNILFKLDSFNPVEVSNIYGISPDMAESQLKNVQKIIKLTRNNNGYVNIGASIVPTKLNYSGIMNTIKECFRIGVYPLLTDLGYSGNVMNEYEALYLGIDEMKEIKSEISEFIGKEYNLPICPSIISGVHINPLGKVTVDSRSGLSCGWFWANEPVFFEIGDINTESFQAINEKILKYRKEFFFSFVKEASTNDNQVFGGCGGNITLLLERYKKIQQGGNS